MASSEHLMTCPNCNGSGRESAVNENVCAMCGGLRTIRRPGSQTKLEKLLRTGKATVKLSPTQTETLARMAADDGTIIRTAGGFWAPPGTPVKRTGLGLYPEWSVNIQTIRAMERKGLVERTHEYPEEWRDTRRLTQSGRA